MLNGEDLVMLTLYACMRKNTRKLKKSVHQADFRMLFVQKLVVQEFVGIIMISCIVVYTLTTKWTEPQGTDIYTHVYKSHRLCQQDVFATSLWQVCEQVVANTVVISSSCYKLVVVSLVATCYVQAISNLFGQFVTISPMKLSTLFQDPNNLYICMKDDLQLGKLKEKCLLLKLYRKPQTGIEPATF